MLKLNMRCLFLEEKLFNRVFEHRIIICYSVIMLLFLSCILRVAATACSDIEETYRYLNCYKLKIANLRGTIYDCNMIPLNKSEEKIIAAVSPTKKGIAAISSVLKDKELNKVLKTLNNGDPAVCEIPKDIKSDGIVTTKIRTSGGSFTPAIHLIGYTDADNNGVSGIEKAYNSLLYSDKSATVYFESDGKGRILEGAKAVIDNDSSVSASGVVTTIDINLQTIAEKAAENIECGAVIIAEAKTAKIRAMVSRPFFDCENIESYLFASNSPLLNRAINAYNVGSVFKPCVAAAGIESNNNSFICLCNGKVEIADRFFKCHKADGHGYMNLKTAIANSCNSYFYNFAEKIGGDKIYNMASSLNFGKEIKLCDDIYTATGNLTDKTGLSNAATLANFSIGQGQLLLSPVSILPLYCSIATDGAYFLPSVIEATLQNGKRAEYNFGKRTKVMDKKTAKILREYLVSVITEGTGEDALPKSVSAAGKTATAQTGKYENGVEISQGWFCGFFPAENPIYVVVVFSENTKKQIKTCNQIFAEIADGVASQKSFENTQ